MKYRKLRIAWSVAWGIVAVLLIALWVRSYWVADVIGRTSPLREVIWESNRGSLSYVRFVPHTSTSQFTNRWSHQFLHPTGDPRFGFAYTTDATFIMFPTCLPTILFLTQFCCHGAVGGQAASPFALC
jgi:hypothetical protein